MGAEKGGGYCTGPAGWIITLIYGVVAVVLAYTGIAGRNNTIVKLGKPDPRLLSPEANDFGRNFFSDCYANGSTYNDGDWQEVFSIGDFTGLKKLELTDIDTLKEFDAEFFPKFPRFVPKNDTSFLGYAYSPEYICNAVCNLIAREKHDSADACIEFTYDGLEADSCRFRMDPTLYTPPKPTPKRLNVSFEDSPHLYIYNNTCINDVRRQFIEDANKPATNLTRPTGFPGEPTPKPPLWTSYLSGMLRGFFFLKFQWAGELPTDYDVPGRTNKAGYTDSCNVGGSFYGGDHLISTMASAEELGTLALGRMWYRDTYGAIEQGAKSVADMADEEIFRQADYLVGAWDGEELVVGVGDQFATGSDGQTSLAAYQSFTDAPNALLIGEPATEFGQQTTVAPVCTKTSPDAPAADVAAHSAAALTLAAQVLNLTSKGSTNKYLDTAKELYAYSKAKAPINTRSNQLSGSLGTDPRVPGGQTKLGASEIYNVGEPEYVFAHQFWAACTLYQYTRDEKYWNDTTTLYSKMFAEPFGSRLYWPIVNFENPAWYGLLCMAQSAPSYAGLEDDVAFRTNLQASDDGSFGGSEELLQIAIANPGEESRLYAVNHLFNNLVNAWLVYDTTSTPVTVTGSGSLRYASYIEEGAQRGLFRDAVNVASMALMLSDMPGVTPQRKYWSQCFARQTLDYVLGDNAKDQSFVVGIPNNAPGVKTPKNPYSKDAACPPDLSAFSGIFSREQDPRNASETINAFKDREVCDYITFYGAEPERQETRPGVGETKQNPTLPNTYEVTGALVSTFDPETETYNDVRGIVEDGAAADEITANPHAGISIDSAPGLINALAGLISAGDDFWARNCPTVAELRAAAREARAAVDGAASTADPRAADEAPSTTAANTTAPAAPAADATPATTPVQA